MSRWIRLAYFAVWFVFALVLHFALGVLPAFGVVVASAIVYLLITLPARTIPLLSLFILFFAGLLIVSHVTLVIQFVIQKLFLPPLWSNDGLFWASVILAPISEELLKLAPLVLLVLIWNGTRARATFSATDVMLCGLAIGAGFELFEDMLGGPARTYAWSLVYGSPVVPSVEVATTRGRPDVVFIGHAASTAFMGLALGWARYFKTPLRYAPVLIALTWMTWTHLLYNGQEDFARGHFFFLTAPLTWMTPWFFFLAALGTALFEWFLRHYRATPVERAYAQRARLSLNLGSFFTWLETRRLLRQLAYARIWVRANRGDREKLEPRVRDIVTQLENNVAQLTRA